MNVLDVRGSARERGRQRGESHRELVQLGLELWRERVGSDAHAGTYLDTARHWTRAAVEELEGMADGAGVELDGLLLFNLADELRVFDAAGHCTSLAATGGAVPVSGQTMDTPAWFEPLRVAIRSTESESGLTTLAFTIAGLLALCGVNSAGVGVWCNALYQLPSSRSGVPVSFLVRHLLSQPSANAAAAVVETVPHASGQHYLLVDGAGAVSLECSGDGVVRVPPAERLWHTNHPLATPDRAGRSSLARAVFVERELSGAASAADLERLLADRRVPVAKTGGDGGYTLWAVVAEHTAPPRVRASAGPPGEERWFMP